MNETIHEGIYLTLRRQVAKKMHSIISDYIFLVTWHLCAGLAS